LEIYEKIIARSLSVRETELLVQKVRKDLPPQKINNLTDRVF
jgi:hypothetical protein